MNAEASEARSARRPTPGRDDEAVTNFLADYGRALSDGKFAEVARLWEAPALVVGDGGVIPVTAAAEVERFFAAAVAQYTAAGITSTRPEVLRLAWASDGIVEVEVRWHQIDKQGDRRGHEVSSYTLRRDDQGALRLRVAVMHAA